MRAEIIAVGTELLIGQITNTNARHISRKLNEYGISVYYHSVVGDNRDRIKEVFKTALERSDLVVMTGGLGPTEDDLTKEAVCESLNIELVLDENILSMIQGYFSKRNIKMARSNEKQAMVPKGAFILHNEKGTAPGFYIKNGEKGIVILPGPPMEMEPMFDYYLSTFLSKDTTIFSKFINIFGIGESTVEERILDLIHADDSITLATYASIGQVVIRITTIAENELLAESRMKKILDILHERFGENIFSDEETTLPIKVSRLLYEHGKTVAVAESCTGGLISKIVTDQPGATKIYLGGVVAYDNYFKQRFLRVSSDLLREEGAVSGNVCRQMAESVASDSGADFGLAVTGIAGPSGGTQDKPIGTVYIGICSNGVTKVKKHIFNGDRNKIRNMAAMTALDMLRRELL